MSNKQPILPGKIAVQLKDRLLIYENSNKSKTAFKIKNNSEIDFGSVTWINNSDKFLGIQYYNTSNSGTDKGDIVFLDLSGKVIEKIFESQKGEIIGNIYLSKNDNWLLFTTEKKGDIRMNPLEGLNRELSIMIMDFNNKKITDTIENIGASPSFELHESPWLYNESGFIYSITRERGIVVEGINLDMAIKQPGIYLYDFMTNTEKLLVPDARFGVCSPVDQRIAFIKDQSIWVMNLKDSTTRIIYKGGANEKISNIHWTPDGQYIYLVYFVNYSHDYYKSGERLIEVGSTSEIPFRKVGHGFHTYTWK